MEELNTVSRFTAWPNLITHRRVQVLASGLESSDNLKCELTLVRNDETIRRSCRGF